MTAARAGDRLSRWNFNVLPGVCREVVHCSLICPAALLKATKNNHVRRLVVNDTGVLIAQKDLVATSSDGLPRHGAEIQIVKFISIQVVLVCVKMTS